MSRLSATMGHVLLCVDARLSAKVNAAGCSRCERGRHVPFSRVLIIRHDLSFLVGTDTFFSNSKNKERIGFQLTPLPA